MHRRPFEGRHLVNFRIALFYCNDLFNSVIEQMWKKGSINSKINGTSKGIYLPISKLHTILAVANSLAHNSITYLWSVASKWTNKHLCWYHLFCCPWHLLPWVRKSSLVTSFDSQRHPIAFSGDLCGARLEPHEGLAGHGPSAPHRPEEGGQRLPAHNEEHPGGEDYGPPALQALHCQRHHQPGRTPAWAAWAPNRWDS